MKIGVLTYHRVINDGSAVQACCLLQLLAERLPAAHIELIDYRPRTHERRERQKVVRFRPFRFNWPAYRKRHSIRRFVREHCPSSATHCTTDDLSRARAFVDRQGYDVIVVGSDTVWENRPTGVAPPWPNIYFLPDIACRRRVALAVSMDRTPESVVWREASWVAEQVGRFEFIGVRDEPTRRRLLGAGVPSQRMCWIGDPAFMGDLGALVEPMGQALGVRPARLAGVAVGRGRLQRAWTRALQAQGYAVVSLLGDPRAGDVARPTHLTLGQRLDLFRQLNLLVTDRFHGSIFALRLGLTPTIFLEPPEDYPDLDSKGRDLFRSLDVEYMVLREALDDPAAHDVGALIARFEHSREELANCLERRREQALAALDQAVARIKES